MKLLLPITEYRVHTLELFVLCSTSSLSLSLFSFPFSFFLPFSLSLSLAGFTAFESDALAPRPGEEAAFSKPQLDSLLACRCGSFSGFYSQTVGAGLKETPSTSPLKHLSLPFSLATAEMISKGSHLLIRGAFPCSVLKNKKGAHSACLINTHLHGCTHSCANSQTNMWHSVKRAQICISQIVQRLYLLYFTFLNKVPFYLINNWYECEPSVGRVCQVIGFG